jgi:DNA-binding transcriptional LysR family regulator
VNLARLDLNLLVALDALLQERSVTRAAERMGLSQPAVSAQLSRLRRHFHDELLARAGNQYRLTPLAVQLKERVRVALAGAERVFAAEPDFDPASSTREFSLLMSDYGIAVLGPSIATLLTAEAPGTRLRFPANTPQMVDSATQVLVNVDLLVIPHGFVEDLSHHDLYLDEWVCLVAADNPEVGESPTVEQLRTMPWVVTYHGPTASTPAARQMRMLGIEPHVQVVTVPDRARARRGHEPGRAPAEASGRPDSRRARGAGPAVSVRGRSAGGGHVVAPDVRRRSGTPLPAGPRRAGRRHRRRRYAASAEVISAHTAPR